MITQTYKLDMVPGGMPQIIHVSQYDAGTRDLAFELHSGAMPWTVPTGATVTIDGTKPDRKAFSVTAAASGATVTATVTQQMTAAAGRAECQLTVTSGSNVLGSANFILDVERAAMAEDADMSATDISSVETAKTQAIDAMQKAQAAQAAAETAKTAAEAATSGKADKTAPTAVKNVALLDASGNLMDSGKQLTPVGIGADPTGTGLWSFTDIPSGSDLNDYTACGYYKVSTLSTVPTLSNCPVSASFTMQVSNANGRTDSGTITGTTWKYRIQRVTDYKTTEYVRLIYTDGSGTLTFSSWKKMLTDDSALSDLGISTGSWTPSVAGMSSYAYQDGRYFKIGNVVIVSFAFGGEMAGSTTARVTVSGCPFTPTGDVYGGGDLSGYYSAENIPFTGWNLKADGILYAKGQDTGLAGEKWASDAIYQKTSGGCYGGGTIMFKTGS